MFSLIPSLLEAPREALDTLALPEPVNMGGAEFPIRLVADEDIKHTDPDGVGYCDNRALLPPACGQPAEERRHIGLLRYAWHCGPMARAPSAAPCSPYWFSRSAVSQRFHH